MRILLTGATGLVGSALRAVLTEAGHGLIPLRRSSRPGDGPAWDPLTGRVDLARAGELDAVIHLAGETVAQRWTGPAKQRIRDSRAAGTRFLCEALARLPQPPRVVVCASATGFYGNRGNEWLDETSPPGSGFLADVTRAWEAAADPIRSVARVVHARIGIVLSRRGGALSKMLPAFKLGLGGPVGDGRQYWSWVSLEDVLAVFERALVEGDWRGAINVVAPEPVTSREFATVLGKVLHRPAVLPLPRIAVSLLLGEMGREALLSSARVEPAFLKDRNFAFRHSQLESSLRAELTPDGT